ncbi:MAG: diguanylate cyclase [Mycobacteriaceae bacterium]
MKLFAGGIPDPYYAVTSRLAARGHQQTAMRVIATCILVLGLPAALAAMNPASSHWGHGALTFAVIALACVAMAVPWMRYRWPSRAQSTAVVVLGTTALTGGCSLATDPLAGLLIATPLVFILGYTALFHGPGLQLFVASASAATVLVLGVRIAMSDIPTALAVVTPVVMLDIVVALGCRIIAEVAAAEGARTDVEPLTGLLTRDGFDELAATLLGARNREVDRYLVVAVVGIDNFGPLQSLQGSRATDRARVAVGQALRETVRRHALLGHVDDGEFVVADTFTTPDPTPLVERIRGAVAGTPQGVTASIGVVCTPLRPLADRPPYDAIEEIVALATTAMYRARRSGGNRAEYVIDKGAQ